MVVKIKTYLIHIFTKKRTFNKDRSLVLYSLKKKMVNSNFNLYKHVQTFFDLKRY